MPIDCLFYVKVYGKKEYRNGRQEKYFQKGISRKVCNLRVMLRVEFIVTFLLTEAESSLAICWWWRKLEYLGNTAPNPKSLATVSHNPWHIWTLTAVRDKISRWQRIRPLNYFERPKCIWKHTIFFIVSYVWTLPCKIVSEFRNYVNNITI